MISNYYDVVFEYNTDNGHIEFLRISDTFLERGITSEKIHSLDEFNQYFAKEMIVSEERSAYLEQVALPYILEETKIKESYVRTVHIKSF